MGPQALPQSTWDWGPFEPWPRAPWSSSASDCCFHCDQPLRPATGPQDFGSWLFYNPTPQKMEVTFDQQQDCVIAAVSVGMCLCRKYNPGENTQKG